MIPLRPELFSFTDPKSLCRLTCTSKTLRKDVRESKAWARLAEAQLPPARPRDAASEALSHVRSQVRRRLLVDSLLWSKPPPTVRPNKFDDFTYFARFSTDDGRVFWEGDLKPCPEQKWGYTLLLDDVWAEITRSEGWDEMETFLSISTHIEHEMEWRDALDRSLARMSITLVAIRDEDQAMVSLGHMRYDACNGTAGQAEQEYIFRPHQGIHHATLPLFQSARFYLNPTASLHVTHDTAGDGTLDHLEFRLEHYSREAIGSHNSEGFVDILERHRYEYLLSYLAGVHHHARGQALATIENWHIEAVAAGIVNG